MSPKQEKKRQDGLTWRTRTLADGTKYRRYRIDLRWRGVSRIVIDYGSSNLAKADKALLLQLKNNGRTDLLEAIADGRTKIANLVAESQRLNVRLVSLPAVPDRPIPTLGELHQRFLTHLAAPTARSPRSGREYADGTKENYTEHLAAVVAALPKGARTMPAQLTRKALKAALGSLTGATKNRRITAVQAWLRWCREEEEVAVPLTPEDFRVLKDREPKGDTSRALTEAELSAVRAHSAPEWSELWLVLARTGLRIEECQTLTGGAVAPGGAAVAVLQEGTGLPRGKSVHARRTVPVLDPEAREILARLAAAAGPRGRLWLPTMCHYSTARARWERACMHAGLARTTPKRPGKPRPAKSKLSGAKPPKRARKSPILPRPLKSMHSLRHLFGVTLSRVNAPSHILRTWMGHGSSELSDRYTRAEADAQDVLRLAAKWAEIRPNATPIATPEPMKQLPAGSTVDVNRTQ